MQDIAYKIPGKILKPTYNSVKGRIRKTAEDVSVKRNEKSDPTAQPYEMRLNFKQMMLAQILTLEPLVYLYEFRFLTVTTVL